MHARAVRIRTLAFASAILPSWVARGGDEQPREPARDREAIDDAPIAVDPRTRVLGAALPVLRGNHRSIQVNVAPSGDDIIDDAANEPSIANDRAAPPVRNALRVPDDIKQPLFVADPEAR